MLATPDVYTYNIISTYIMGRQGLVVGDISPPFGGPVNNAYDVLVPDEVNRQPNIMPTIGCP